MFVSSESTQKSKVSDAQGMFDSSGSSDSGTHSSQKAKGMFDSSGSSSSSN